MTREGARLADVGLRPAPLVLSQLDHTIAVVALTEFLLAKHKGAELVTERELRATRYREMRDKQAFRIEGSRRRRALLRIPTKGAGAQGIKTVAIELDLSRKDRREQERIVRAYDSERDVSEVWWFVRPTRVDATKAVVKAQRAEDRFKVLTYGPRSH